MSASVVACERCRHGPAQGRTAFFLNRNPSRRRNSQTALCETLPPRDKLLLQPVQRQMRRLADPFQDEGAMRF